MKTFKNIALNILYLSELFLLLLIIILERDIKPQITHGC
jgi:hypothetical protein